eukprot:TRINITY_DN38535_c0_g1_i1.p1 TRINITY_DN38535_c0_g1~~TRINITY_DN38535_c0_g1_i1.p1  ORF type:complete len:316 (-),score=24.38 TRINITY_DN38535_c0_g1_i1:269-1216(-)
MHSTRGGSVYLVFLVICVYAAHWYVYHFSCEPDAIWAVVFNVLLLMGLWSYVQTYVTDPGTPTCPEWKAWFSSRTAEVEAKMSEAETKTMSSSWDDLAMATWCEICCTERPQRAHHCRSCSVCVLRMDHHCPWVGTCVGFRNHKFFVLMNLWSCCASVVFLLTARKPNTINVIISMIDPTMQSEGLKSSSMVYVSCFMTAFVVVLVTGVMFSNSAMSVMKNITTLEKRFLLGENPYCCPSTLANIEQVFGALDYRMFLPLSPKFESPRAGTCFPVVEGYDARRKRDANAAEQRGLDSRFYEPSHTSKLRVNYGSA